MSVSLPASNTGTDKRRTTRVVQAIPVVVRGIDALGQAFKESTATVMVNCNGCKYRSRHYVPKDSRVTVEVTAPKDGGVARIVPARVVWVQRPQTFREIFHVAVEFEVPGNVWPLEKPPADWFPHPDDEHLDVPVSGGMPDAEQAAEPPDVAKPLYIPSSVNLPATTATSAERTLPLLVPPHSNAADPEQMAARAMVTTAIEAVIAKEMPSLRERLEWRLQESVQETIKSLAQTISEALMKDFASQAAERTAAIVVEARTACWGNTSELDERIRQLVREVAAEAQEGARKPAARKKKRKLRKGELETVSSS